MKTQDYVHAANFESRKVYHSAQTPGYTSWVSFFPGEKGQWYLTCEEVTRPGKPLPKITREQFHEISLPIGYDKSQYLMEIVMFESTDGMESWRQISRQPCRYHHSAGSFGQARTMDGRFLRFVWSVYSLDPSRKANEIFFVSEDGGASWRKMPPFHHPAFASYPHRLRMLRDGTLVLAVPLAPRYGKGTDRPVRASMNLNAIGEMTMTLFFSHDQGRSWEGPVLIYGGQVVSETDFVELPNGNLLLVNNSIFANPGRQIVYREGKRWTPGAMERVISGKVPETVCITEEGILVGCLRNSTYLWSDDLGMSWWPLEGIPDRGKECYQPWIQYIGEGRFACAGHYGGDDAPGTVDQYLMIHFFDLVVTRKTADTSMRVEREWSDAENRWVNAYAVTLTAGGKPLEGMELELWYVDRDAPGYDSWNKEPLAERMKSGGTAIRARTDAGGKTCFAIPAYDAERNPHHSYQFVVRFNADRRYPDFKPAQSPQFEFYAYNYQDPAI